MKTKIVFDDIQLNTVPCEKLIYSSDNNLYVLVDDINEKRWEIEFISMMCFRIISIDLGYDYNGEDFDCYRYDENGCKYFRNHILKVIDSEWIEQLKNQGKHNNSIKKEVEKSNHYLITFYDYELEVIAQDIIVKSINE